MIILVAVRQFLNVANHWTTEKKGNNIANKNATVYPYEQTGGTHNHKYKSIDAQQLLKLMLLKMKLVEPMDFSKSSLFITTSRL